MPRSPVALLAACAGGVAVAGCGGSDDKDAVQTYLRQANAIQKTSAADFRRANQVYADFSRGRLEDETAIRDLGRAEGRIRATGERLSRLDPPARAEGLHERLVRVYALSAGFAAESTQLGRYAPAAAEAVEPLQAATRKLRAGLRASERPASQRRVFAAYADTVERRVDRLDRLDPPPVLAATHRSQVRRLRSTVRLARGLRDAVGERDSARVGRLLLRFRRNGEGGGDTKLMARSIRAYNRRYERLTDAGVALQRERERVGRELDDQ